MAFQFQKPLDVSSLQKRYEEKESRRAQKHVPNAQENSKRLQMSLGLSHGASLPTQMCDVPVLHLAYGEDDHPRPDTEPLSINTNADMASSGDGQISTAAISVDRHGIVLGNEPLAWDVGSPNECFNVDTWPDPSPRQREGADMHDASDINAQRDDLQRDDYSDRPASEEPGFACLSPAIHKAGNVLEAATAPSQHHDISVKVDAAQIDACLSDHGDAGAAVQPPIHALHLTSTLMTEEAASYISPHAQSEESNAAIEETSDPPTSEMRPIEVLIEARPPQDTAPATGSDYPTPSSDLYQASEEPAKSVPSGRKRTYRTAFNDTRAVDSLSQPKRQRDAAATSQNTSDGYRRLNSSAAALTHISMGNYHQAVPRDSSVARVVPPQSQHAHATRPHGNSSSNTSQAVAASVLKEIASVEANMTRTCTSCGVNRTHLMRLSRNILQWADLPDPESVLTTGTSLSTRERRAIMLRLAFGNLRDYLLEPLLEDDMELPADKSRSFQHTHARNRTNYSASLGTDKAAPYSKAGDSRNAPNNATHPTKDDSHKLSRARIEDASVENARTMRRKPRGRPPRPWSTDDETRLLEYLSKGMDWSDIATALKRSEAGVQQHARIMGQERTAWPTLDDLRLRAYMIEGMGWSEIAKKLKRAENDVLLRWCTMPHP